MVSFVHCCLTYFQNIITDCYPTGLAKVSGSDVTPGKDFTALAKQIKAVGEVQTATKMNSSSVAAAAGTARDCPAVTGKGGWAAAEALPPTPDKATCESMVASLSCVPSETVATKDIGSLFGTVCGMDSKACEGITGDATAGTYGDYVMCNATQQLAYALNQYYVNQGQAATACDFSGQAKLVTPTQTNGAASGDGSSGSTTGSGTTGSSTSGNTSGGTASSGSGQLGGNRKTVLAVATFCIGVAMAM